MIEGRSRTAYILHSLKRPAEIQLLREIYRGQFLLLAARGQSGSAKPISSNEIYRLLMRLISFR